MKFRSLTFLLIPLAAVALAGCKAKDHENTGENGSTAESGDHEGHAHGKNEGHADGDREGHDHGEGEAHAHPSEGPHGGALVELGAEEYHAELVHDDQAVTFYILDGKAESLVAIDASEVAVNLQHDGQGKQFKLAAKPQSQDAEGKSSRFVSADAGLAQELDHEHGDAQLVATIAGKQYRGKIEHHHGHGAHDHEGEGHDHERNGNENGGHEGHSDD